MLECLDWLRVPGGIRAQFRAAAGVSLSGGLQSGGRTVLKPDQGSNRKPILTFHILNYFFFPGQAQCKVVKDTNKIQNKSDGRRGFGRGR